MGDDRDDDGGDDGDGRVPPFSRIGRGGGGRRYRGAARSRYARLKQQIPLRKLIGGVLRRHGLSNECRQRFICINWPEIAGERIAPKTHPTTVTDGVLHVAASSSAWVQELRFFKDELVKRVNDAGELEQDWLGPAPLVTDMRFAFASRERDPFVDRDQLRELRERHQQRTAPRSKLAPPSAISDVDREAIEAEASAIADPDVRDEVTRVRLRWNR